MSDAAETIDVRIMLLVGSNGRVMASIEGQLGWGDLQDGIMDFEPGKPAADPSAEERYVLTATVPVPRPKAPKEIQASRLEVSF